MTRQESFKRRVRARMEKTGERYGASRRALIEKSSRATESGRQWVSQPEMTDDAVRDATGRGWDEWCDLIEARSGSDDDHTAIAAELVETHGLDGWWAQTVTVGFERITGRRLPYQLADGTFSVSKSKTVSVDGSELREMLLDESSRRDLLPGLGTTLRSKPSSKALRLGLDEGVAVFSIDPQGDGRQRITVTHERLRSPDDVEAWRAYWSEWLEAIAHHE